MVSPVGALGHTQFMPCTWVGWSHPTCGGLGAGNISSSDLTSLTVIKKYGGFGVDASGDKKADPFNPHDAIFTAAKYLASNGAAGGRVEEALLAYNHSEEYVQKVMGYAIMYVDMSGEGGTSIVENGMSWPVPCTTVVTSPFGPRLHPIHNVYKMHNGIDIAEGRCNNSPIVSAVEGTVSYSGDMGGYGLVVFVDHGNGLQTRYAHLSGITVRTGQKVSRGATVGFLGSTGDSTGPHLHYETRLRDTPYDPMKFYK